MEVKTNKIYFPKSKLYLIDWWKVIKDSDLDDHKRIRKNINQCILFYLEQMPFKKMESKPETGFSFDIPKYKYINIFSRNYIVKKNHAKIVKYMSQLFDLLFFFHMKEYKNQIQKGIWMFIEKYHLNIERYEMLRKKYYRNN